MIRDINGRVRSGDGWISFTSVVVCDGRLVSAAAAPAAAAGMVVDVPSKEHACVYIIDAATDDVNCFSVLHFAWRI